MTPDGVYLRMIGSTKAPHWLPHFIPDKVLLQEISYQTHTYVVSSSLTKSRKGAWTPFPLSTKMCRVENIKQAKEEVNVLSPFKFRETSFKIHDPEGLLEAS